MIDRIVRRLGVRSIGPRLLCGEGSESAWSILRSRNPRLAKRPGADKRKGPGLSHIRCAVGLRWSYKRGRTQARICSTYKPDFALLQGGEAGSQLHETTFI